MTKDNQSKEKVITKEELKLIIESLGYYGLTSKNVDITNQVVNLLIKIDELVS